MSCMSIYDILGLHRVLGGVDRARLIEECPHKHREKIGEKRTNYVLFEVLACKTCGSWSLVRVEEQDPAPDQELFIPSGLARGVIQKEGMR